ncbi:MAG: RecQ family ATP-dependent DNA helicase [Lutibacter sp.]|uniref:RecQ family ATP-dependent DNA helicase n=1 Tax=Lutibacter sp. TaxID=1925666 RepID=UPI0019E4948D|nr:ATP-dependent DNA helicase RecQ [Lutibacter sp.]NOR28820.1 RecQ family ATP-dependent DNA helicase [Lutibacter sp.]
MNTPLEILKKYWGYPKFRNPQEEIIETILAKKNTVVLLPTGGGKSLCYQVPALISDGVCIVISPLIALIQDQVNSLQSKNIKAIALTSQLNKEETITAFDNLQFGNVKFLYLSPEKLQSAFIQEKIKQLNVSIVAIDEAHCISEWGHDFRPSYLQLNILKELQAKATFIALTATATQIVLNDIQQNLELEKAVVYKESFQRTNLNYHVITTENIYGKLLQIVRKIDESVIIYTNSRKQTKEVCTFLLKNNFKSSYYHGGLSNIEKNTSFNNWMSNDTPIMVATNAFGMGIDKPDVRTVIHINTPNSLENFIQEAGRAGRDGKQSYSIILTNKSTVFETTSKFSLNVASTKFVKTVYNHLCQYFNIALGELPIQLFDFSLQEFCFTYKLKLLQTYNAIKTLERENIINLDENYTKKSTLKFLISSTKVFDYINNHPSKKDLIQLILRSYGGVFDHYTIINEFTLSKKVNASKKEIITHLNDLHSNGIINYSHKNTTSKLSFQVARDHNYTINSISKSIEQQNNLKLEKLNATISYIQNTKTCRNIQLLSYFNEIITKNCGTCDVCKSKIQSKNSVETVLNQILHLLTKKSLSSQEISTHLNYSETEILNSLKILLEQNKIAITSQNKFKRNF